MSRKWYSMPYAIWSFIFIIVPLLLVIYFGFTAEDGGKTTFSLYNFRRFFSPIYLGVFWRSILYAGISTLICLLIGYPTALILTGRSLKHKNLMVLLIVIPMWMNLLLRTYAWLSILENEGLINQFLRYLGILKEGDYIQFLYGRGAVIFGMVYNFLPFMILPIYSVIAKTDYSLIEAAEDLGADSLRVFLKVTLPLSLPGVVSGITMVFVPAITTFAISSILCGNKVNLLGNVIEKQFGIGGNWNFGSAMSLVLMVIILFSMSIMTKYEKENEGGGLI